MLSIIGGRPILDERVILHRPSGFAWAPEPWVAVQRAAWKGLRRREAARVAAAPHRARRAAVDPSGRRQELVGGLPARPMPWDRARLGPYRRFWFEKKTMPI